MRVIYPLHMFFIFFSCKTNKFYMVPGYDYLRLSFSSNEPFGKWPRGQVNNLPNTHFVFYRQLDFSSELEFANEILKNEPKSCWTVALFYSWFLHDLVKFAILKEKVQSGWFLAKLSVWRLSNRVAIKKYM